MNPCVESLVGLVLFWIGLVVVWVWVFVRK